MQKKNTIILLVIICMLSGLQVPPQLIEKRFHIFHCKNRNHHMQYFTIFLFLLVSFHLSNNMQAKQCYALFQSQLGRNSVMHSSIVKILWQNYEIYILRKKKTEVTSVFLMSTHLTIFTYYHNNIHSDQFGRCRIIGID